MKRIIYVCFSRILFYACTSSDNNQDQRAAELNLYALKVCNEWEYRCYGISKQGIEVPSDLYESRSIVATEIINERLYYKFSFVIFGKL